MHSICAHWPPKSAFLTRCTTSSASYIKVWEDGNQNHRHNKSGTKELIHHKMSDNMKTYTAIHLLLAAPSHPLSSCPKNHLEACKTSQILSPAPNQALGSVQVILTCSQDWELLVQLTIIFYCFISKEGIFKKKPSYKKNLSEEEERFGWIPWNCRDDLQAPGSKRDRREL